MFKVIKFVYNLILIPICLISIDIFYMSIHYKLFNPSKFREETSTACDLLPGVCKIHENVYSIFVTSRMIALVYLSKGMSKRQIVLFALFVFLSV